MSKKELLFLTKDPFWSMLEYVSGEPKNLVTELESIHVFIGQTHTTLSKEKKSDSYQEQTRFYRSPVVLTSSFELLLFLMELFL